MATPPVSEPLTEPAPDAVVRAPWWARHNPMLGQRPALTARQWRVLGMVSVAALFSQYDRALLVMALPQIQAGLAVPEAQLGGLGALVRLGALPAVAIAAAADRVGRRRILLITLIAYTLLTGATAAAPSAGWFVAFQVMSQAFTAAEMLIAIVVVSEELPARHRGWGIGALFMLQGLGAGLAALLLPLAGASPHGWRGLYAVGLVPLLMLAWWRRSLPETERFARQRTERSGAGWTDSARALARSYPGRLAAVCAAFFALALGGAPADFFGPKYLQDAHGWTPGQVTLLYMTGGAVAIFGGAFAGWLSDRFGRRRAVVGFGTAVVACAVTFYGAHGPWLAPAWVALIFANLGTEVLLAAYATELFPTSQRATASGVRLLVATLGAGLGLGLEGLLYDHLGGHWHAVAAIACVALVTPLVAGLTLPETAGRSLEDIAPDPARPCERSTA